MAKVYVTEYARATQDSRANIPSAEEPPLATQVLDTTAGVIASNFFNKETRMIRVHTDGICSVVVGTAPVATTSNSRMAANQTEYFGIPRPAPDASASLYKISAITNT